MRDKDKEIIFVENLSDDNRQPLEHGDYLEPPFWGTSNVLQWTSDAVFGAIKKELLFRNEWSGVCSERSGDVKPDLDDSYDRIKVKAAELDLFQASGFYGFFPVITEDNVVVILDPSDFHTEIMSLRFPELKHASVRSISDFFKPTGDIITLQISTLGPDINKKIQLPGNEIENPILSACISGLASHCSEIIAEKVTTEVRRCLGLERSTGRRYDFGNSGMPESQLLPQLFELLSVEERLGVELTDRFEIKPEYSSISVFVHHPEA